MAEITRYWCVMGSVKSDFPEGISIHDITDTIQKYNERYSNNFNELSDKYYYCNLNEIDRVWHTSDNIFTLGIVYVFTDDYNKIEEFKEEIIEIIYQLTIKYIIEFNELKRINNEKYDEQIEILNNSLIFKSKSRETKIDKILN